YRPTSALSCDPDVRLVRTQSKHSAIRNPDFELQEISGSATGSHCDQPAHMRPRRYAKSSAKKELTIRRSGSARLTQSQNSRHRSPLAAAKCFFSTNGVWFSSGMPFRSYENSLNCRRKRSHTPRSVKAWMGSIVMTSPLCVYDRMEL